MATREELLAEQAEIESKLPDLVDVWTRAGTALDASRSCLSSIAVELAAIDAGKEVPDTKQQTADALAAVDEVLTDKLGTRLQLPIGT